MYSLKKTTIKQLSKIKSEVQKNGHWVYSDQQKNEMKKETLQENIKTEKGLSREKVNMKNESCNHQTM